MESVIYQNQEIKRWDVGPSTFLALPEKGARLLNWHINMSDGSVRDVIHWPEEPDIRFTLNKLTEESPYYFHLLENAMTPEMKTIGDLDRIIYPMPMHGFARESDFRFDRWINMDLKLSLSKPKK